MTFKVVLTAELYDEHGMLIKKKSVSSKLNDNNLSYIKDELKHGFRAATVAFEKYAINQLEFK